MTATVLDFPSLDQAQLPAVERDTEAVITRLVPRVSAPAEPLHEILRKAVVAYRSSEVRSPGSFASRHHLAICHAYLDAAAIVAGSPDIAPELGRSLDAGIFDIKKLTRIARDFDGPAPA
jgi:hypothetical protein